MSCSRRTLVHATRAIHSTTCLIIISIASDILAGELRRVHLEAQQLRARSFMRTAHCNFFTTSLRVDVGAKPVFAVEVHSTWSVDHTIWAFMGIAMTFVSTAFIATGCEARLVITQDLCCIAFVLHGWWTHEDTASSFLVTACINVVNSACFT
jgi:hypothetical protein